MARAQNGRLALPRALQIFPRGAAGNLRAGAGALSSSAQRDFLATLEVQLAGGEVRDFFDALDFPGNPEVRESVLAQFATELAGVQVAGGEQDERFTLG